MKMKRTDFQSHLLQRFAGHMLEAVEASKEFGDKPVPENLWRAENLAFLSALADVLVEIGVLDPD